MAEVQKAALESYNKIKAERGEVTALDMFIAGRDWFKDQMMKDAIPFYQILKEVPTIERDSTMVIIIKE